MAMVSLLVEGLTSQGGGLSVRLKHCERCISEILKIPLFYVNL